LAKRAVAAAKTAESIAHAIQVMGNMVRRGKESKETIWQKSVLKRARA
jgi:hypothetical protein